MKPGVLARIRSFKLRIALLSTLLSGAVLVVFGSLTLASVQRINLQDIDKDIREFGHRHLREFGGPRHWERVSEAARFLRGDGEEDALILLVKDSSGRAEYASPNWPADFTIEAFPTPEGHPDQEALPGAQGSSPPRRPPPGMPPPDGRRGPDPGGREQRGPREGRPGSRGGPFPGQPPLPAALSAPELSTWMADGLEWRVGVMSSEDITIVLGLNMKRLNAEMAQVRRALLTALPLALLAIAAGAWWVARRALKPIEALTGTIKRVKDKGLDQRVSGQDVDREFSELIAVFNAMMDWLEKSFRQAIRFSADASHELKTPLTILQAQLERAQNEPEPGSDEQRRYEALAKELQRLKSITKKLLLLSRIDAGELKLNLCPLNLSQLVEAIVEDTETLAPHLTVQSRIVPDLWVMADADLMKQVTQNLATNAIKYNRKGGYVHMDLQATDQRVRLVTANTGHGIRPKDRDKVFVRFYRGDKSRSRRVSGAGLGLSLAREIVRAHHGELVLQDSSEGTTVFTLTLPRAR